MRSRFVVLLVLYNDDRQRWILPISFRITSHAIALLPRCLQIHTEGYGYHLTQIKHDNETTGIQHKTNREHIVGVGFKAEWSSPVCTSFQYGNAHYSINLCLFIYLNTVCSFITRSMHMFLLLLLLLLLLLWWWWWYHHFSLGSHDVLSVPKYNIVDEIYRWPITWLHYLHYQCSGITAVLHWDIDISFYHQH